MPLPLPSDEHPHLHRFIDWSTDSLGIPVSFLNRLGTDDDWTVVIKLHAMLEAGLNRIIGNALADPRLSDIIARLDTGDRQKGKLAFAKALELVPGESRNLIRMLSELRNELVHDVRNFEFSFKKWIEEMKEADLRNLRKYVATLIKRDVPYGEETLTSAASLHRNPRYTIMLASLIIMGHISKRDLNLPPGEME